MTPQQLRLIADIIEFDMPCRLDYRNGVAHRAIPFSTQVGDEINIELTPGDGYEFIPASESRVDKDDEIYSPGRGWVPFLLAVCYPDSLYRRKLPVHPPFGDPPEDFTWHNPDSLTPEQVGTADGWRLCLASEQNLPAEVYMKPEGQWVDAENAIHLYGESPYEQYRNTYRTKAPLPETEWQKFEKWFTPRYVTDSLRSTMFEAWKAARQSK